MLDDQFKLGFKQACHSLGVQAPTGVETLYKVAEALNLIDETGDPTGEISAGLGQFIAKVAQAPYHLTNNQRGLFQNEEMQPPPQPKPQQPKPKQPKPAQQHPAQGQSALDPKMQHRLARALYNFKHPNQPTTTAPQSQQPGR